MIHIYLNEKEIKNFIDWKLWKDSNDKICLTVMYPSGKKHTENNGNWRIEPNYKLKGDLLFHKRKKIFQQIDKAISIGDKYLVLNYKNNDIDYIMNFNEVDISESTKMTSSDIYEYFRNVASERVSLSEENNKIIAENIERQFNKIIPFQETALNAYLTKEVYKRHGLAHLIYPFGINKSQLDAVKQAFQSQISIIEGPPGTGKTQTILNIISNIIVNGFSCAIVSNNNSAVENVYEKLAKLNLDFLVAKLGNGENKKDFFNSIKYQKPAKCDPVSIETIDLVLNDITQYLEIKNEYAKIMSEIDEIKIEKKYLEDWFNDTQIHYNNESLKSKSSMKTIELLTYLRTLPESSLTFFNKLKLLLNHRIFKSDFLNDHEQRLLYIFQTQLAFYNKLLNERISKKENLEKILEKSDYDNILIDLKTKSLDFLCNYITENMPDPDKAKFVEKSYKKDFSEFMKVFPIIGSSTHSLMNSIADGYLLDYVIIDEASQQDLIPGILCLACARNVVIVGDRKQLSHIPVSSQMNCPNEVYDCTKYSLLDSVCELFENEIPRTLLKEHYRCHPKIIQYCNKQFYNNQLIPMRKDNGEEALSLVVTALGNHMRKNANLREIESIIKTHEVSGYISENKGFIAPYNAQVKLANKILSHDIKKDTIHKFQGRECDEIYFSTVLDKKVISKMQIDFVDNASLVNVAVSRAVNKFVLVTGKNVFANNNKYIASLIRYIKYYANEDEQYDSPVISAFDLLYKEFDKSLEKLQSKLSKKDSKYKSEQIVAAILRNILQQEEFASLHVHKQVFLKQIVKQNLIDLTDRENDFINHGSSCDFAIYYDIGKTPIAIIEVDGGYHDLPKQQERDNVKDSILKKVDISLLRLSTVSSDIEIRIINHLRISINSSQDDILLQ